MLTRLKKIGPGAMVAAAFIGPGTVTTATLSGAGFGYALLWAVLFSVFATCVLQEMTVRLGVIGGKGLGEAIRSRSRSPMTRYLAIALITSAIFIGNAAYEAGNITGAGLGFGSYLTLDMASFNPVYFLIGLAAFALLITGRYTLIERSLVILVGILGLVFISTAILSKPDLGAVVKGLFVPGIPHNSLLMIVGLIGTTVVPYNLFLHASSVRHRFPEQADLPDARWDSVVSILIGGIITICIVVASAASVGSESISLETVEDLGRPLQVLLGSWSTFFMALGFLAAGLSSAITAPLAAAFAITGVLGWDQDMGSKRFRLIWIPVLMAGIVFSSLGLRPISIIFFAQVSNGIILPVIAIFLLWTMNDQKIMGSFVNSKVINILGILVVVITFLLGIRSFFSAFNFL